MPTVVFWWKEETNFYDASKDWFSQKAGEISQWSYENSDIVQWVSLWKGYRWGRVLQVRKEFHSLFNGIGIYPDGVGTKVIPHASMWKQFIAAHDIAAMTLDDAITQGDWPTSFNSVLDARDISEDEEGFVRMIQELGSIAREQGVILLAWETANLGSCVWTPDSKSKSAFNWSGFATSLKHPLINHANGNKTNFRKLEAGNIVVALEQWGFRSNGISAVRRAFEAQYWANWYREAPQAELENAFQASKVYARAVGEALGWHNPFSSENVESDEFEFQVDIRWIAHLSGGSFEGKFREWLLEKSWVSAILDNLYPTPEIVKKVFEWQKKIPQKLWRKSDVVTLNDVYQTFCSWQGMLVVVWNQSEADKLLKILDKNNINARKAGTILGNEKSSSSKLTITGAHIGID
jgi:phosphoribosylaminoimidazole (AIR) synthetase